MSIPNQDMPQALAYREDSGWKKALTWGAGTWMGMYCVSKAVENIASSTTSLASSVYESVCATDTFRETACQFVGNSSNFMYNLPANHPYVSVILATSLLGVASVAAYKKRQALSTISSQAFEKIKQGAKYASNILKYNKKELFITAALTGASAIHISPVLAIETAIAGAAYIAGDNKDTKKALTMYNNFVKTVNIDVLKKDAQVKSLGEKDAEIQAFKREASQFKMQYTTLERQYKEQETSLIKNEALVREYSQMLGVDNQQRDSEQLNPSQRRAPAANRYAAQDPVKDRAVRRAMNNVLSEAQKASLQASLRTSDDKLQFRTAAYAALDNGTIERFLSGLFSGQRT